MFRFNNALDSNFVATFILNNGTISGNSAHEGAGVSLGGGFGGGLFIMHNGAINYNIARATRFGRIVEGYGGGVFVSSSRSRIADFTMYSGTISNNIAGFGGGVNNNGDFTMNTGVISGNSTTEGDGGGVRNTGTFTMNKGRINSNVAHTLGGGVSHTDGTFTFEGGWIFDNNAVNNDEINIGAAGTFNNNVFDIDIGAIGTPPLE